MDPPLPVVFMVKPVNGGNDLKMEETMMKKLLTGVLAAALVLAAGTSTVFAVGHHGGHHHGLGAGTAAACAGWSDADGDGVCDNWGSGARLGAGDGSRQPGRGHHGAGHGRAG